ncbi:MAG: DUF4358 domain-containing protein [Oscillospiraceae bacterium]
MKKYLALALAAIMVMSFAGCSDSKENISTPSESSSSSDVLKPESKPEETKPEDKPAEPEKTVSPADIEAAFAKTLGDGYFCTVDVPEEEIFLSNMAGIDLSQLESYTAKQTAITAVYPDTVLVMKCKPDYADTAVDILNENYARTISYIRQYPFGVAKVEGARLYKIGDIVMFILAGNSADSDATAEDEAKLAASEYEKIDSTIKELFGTLPENLAVITEPEIPDNGGEFDGGFDGGFDDMPIIGG